MKLNVFIPTGSGGNFTGRIPYKSITGQIETGPISPEDAIIDMIDESRMSVQEVLAKRFKTFLGNRRMKLEDFENLEKEEQDRLKKEFFAGETTSSSTLCVEKESENTV